MSPSRPTQQGAPRPRTTLSDPAVRCENVNRRLLEIGRRIFRLEHLRADMDAQVNRVRALFVERIERLTSEITEQEAALEGAVAEARMDLMPGRSKTATLAFGSVSFRTTPPAVKLLRGIEPEKVAQKLRDLDHEELIRERLEPNLPVIKDALAAGQVTAVDLKSAGILIEPGGERFGYKLDRTEIAKVGDA